MYIKNSGGIYLAYSLKHEKNVIVKEARPYTATSDNYYDSIRLRQNEYYILNKLKNKEYTPTPLDSFYDWEHYFIVVSEVKGKDLIEYASDIDTSIFFSNDLSKVYEKHRIIYLKLLEALRDLHNEGITLGDVSPTNIFISDDEQKITFLDFELANTNKEENWSLLFYESHGYRLRKEVKMKERFLLDKEGLGLVLFRLYSNGNEYLNISDEPMKNILRLIERDFKLPSIFSFVIEQLIFNSSNISLDKLITMLQNYSVTGGIKKEIRPFLNVRSLEKELDFVITASAETIIRNKTSSNTNQIFPTYPTSNSNSLYFGDLGVILTLDYIDSKYTESIKKQYLSNYQNSSYEFPGLFMGLSGEAIGLFLLGFKQLALSIMEKAHENKLMIMDCVNLRDGLSGYGIANIFFYEKTGCIKYLNRAEKIGERIVELSETTDEGMFWLYNDRIEYGFGQGISGVIYFFSKLSRVSNVRKYLNICKRLIEYISMQGKTFEGCLLIPKNSDNSSFSPYLEGAVGFAKSIIEFLKHSNDNEVHSILLKVLNGLYLRIAKSPSYDCGLAGIGDVLLDYYELSGDGVFQEIAQKIAEGILQYKITDERNNLFFPSSLTTHISFDFATGMSGTLYFLERLRRLLSNENS